MHGMYDGQHGCNCNCEPLTQEEEKERLTDFRKMLEKKLERVKKMETKLAEK